MTSNQKTSVPLNTAESWEAARKIAALAGVIPSSFTSSIRSLKSNGEANRASKATGLSSASKFLVGRLFRTPSMLAPLYYMALTFFPDKDEIKGATSQQLISYFSPDELASTIGSVYLIRKIRKFVGDEVNEYTTQGHILFSEVAGHCARAIPRFVFHDALLFGALQHVGLALLYKSAPQYFKEYRRAVKNLPTPFDLQLQASLWKCTHLQVIATLAQQAGFGVNFSDSLVVGSSASSLAILGANEEAVRFKVLSLWVDSLIATGKEPNMAHRGEYYPLKAALDNLIERVESTRQGPSVQRWFERGKEDLNSKEHASLLGQRGPSAAEPAGAEPPSGAPVSEEDLEEITEE